MVICKAVILIYLDMQIPIIRPHLEIRFESGTGEF